VDREDKLPRTDSHGSHSSRGPDYNADRLTPDRDQSQAEDDQRTSSRDEAAARREHAAADRDQVASDRDQSQPDAKQRAADRDQSAADREHAAEDRIHTASDREHRRADRALAADDRVHTASDREQARSDLRRSQFDQLTGAFGRELGMVEIEREINRARRGSGRLVLAYVDVDGLKQVNDRRGHAVGDALLRDVVGAIQTHLRSYDRIVRVGGDEFVCTLADSAPEDARRRFQEIAATIEQTQPGASISVGFAALHPEDTLEQLTERGDTALYEARHSKLPRA
jgi:diguanylate cyclase (GGDEF)-like protein